MKKILIIAPHFPPSNLAAIHRSRLFANHLPSMGWDPTILTVNEKYYEEKLDLNLVKLLPENLKIEKVSAFPVKPVKLIGDIGIRAFIFLLFKAYKIIKREKIDFLYIPIPNNYCALLGRILNKLTGIEYGIDYIDPWVHSWPGTEVKYSKHWWSMKLAEWLEPIAVKNASLITGVAIGYYQAVFERNPHLQGKCLSVAMPYGGEIRDVELLKLLNLKSYLFQSIEKIDLVYAGAMLPKAYLPLENMMKAIQNNISLYNNVRFHFIGTGKSPDDPNGYNIKDMAIKYGLWQSVIFEYPKRIPYLDVLIHLESADGIFILGSTEPHYTPSKVYQGVMSKKPILAILHTASTAVSIIKDTNVGVCLDFEGESGLFKIEQGFNSVFKDFLEFKEKYDYTKINYKVFEEYSAASVTKLLVEKLNLIVTN